MSVNSFRYEDRQNDLYKEITVALKEIKFGSVEIIIHNGKIVQIEKKEKIRFNQEHPVS